MCPPVIKEKSINKSFSPISFIEAIQIHLLGLLALCLCLEDLDNDLLLLNQESTLDPNEHKKTLKSH
jgi:hypothetical protein